MKMIKECLNNNANTDKPMRFHYTYYSYEEWGRGYIGSRSCKCLPVNDIHYFGSFRDKTFRPTQKVILEVHNSAEESLEAENKMMKFYDAANNPHFANRQVNGGDKPASVLRGDKNGMWGRQHNEETKRLIADKARGRKASPETKVKMSQKRKGVARPQSSAALSEALKGREITWGDKISVAKKGKPTGRKMSEAQKKAMQEGKRRARDARLNNNKAMSDEDL